MTRLRWALPILVMLLFTGVAQAASPSVSVSPSLQPLFNPRFPNYVTRCTPNSTVTVKAQGNGTPISVDGGAAQTGTFSQGVPLSTGQRFSFTVGSQSYNVRCLPSDFPHYSFTRYGTSQAAYWLTTPTWSETKTTGTYVVMFDGNGVPVWWYDEGTGQIPVDADLTPAGDFSWSVEPFQQSFARPGTVRVEVHDLDGNLLDTLNTVGTPTDFHEARPLADGSFLIDSYVLTIGGGSPLRPNVMDASFQNIQPDGQSTFTWNSAGIISPSESMIWLNLSYPGQSGTVWDAQHINTVVPYRSGYLISLRNNNAVYYIDGTDGHVIWKLGGTTTPQSLTILGDPDASTDFGGQHDVEPWPDGTISLHDNGTGRGRAPRVLRFQINAAARTATLVQSFSDPHVTSSLCCGSARMMPTGDWLVDWGNSQIIEEFNPAGTVVDRLKLAWPLFSYRAVPIMPGQLSASAVIAGMDSMYPRPVGG